MLPTIETARLSLRLLTVDVIDALLGGDAAAFHMLSAAGFPLASPIPPLMEDALPYTREWLLTHPGADAWSWFGVDRAREAAVVCGGLGFGLDDRGVATLGYSVYPEFEGQGYASELARALVAWAFEQTPAVAVEATIPPEHAASVRVATKAGLRLAGSAVDPEVGAVLVYRIDR